MVAGHFQTGCEFHIMAKVYSKCMCMCMYCVLTWLQEYDGHGIIEDLWVLLSENTSEEEKRRRRGPDVH